MAIASVSPSSLRRSGHLSSADVAKKADLKLVSTKVATKGVDKRAFALLLTLVAGAGLLALLAINTALSQGAFELSRLNAQATTLNDQREAVRKQIARESSPQVLSYRAGVAGMVPSISPRFLTVGPSAEPTATVINTKAIR